MVLSWFDPVAVEWRGAIVVKKILGWGLLAFLIFYIVTQPSSSADIARALGSGAQSIASGLGDFVTGLV